MSTLVSGIYSRSLNLAKVAKEIVTETYKSNSSAAEYIGDIKDKILHLDQVYLDAAKKVTPSDEEDIKGLLEYRLISFGTRQLGNVTETAQKGLGKVSEVRDSLSENVAKKKQELSKRLDDKKNQVKSIIISCKDRFTNTFEVKLSSAKTQIAGIRSKSVVLVRQAATETRARAASASRVISDQLYRAADAVNLRQFLDTVQQKFISLGKYSLKEISQIKTNFVHLFEYLSDRIRQTDLINSIKRGGKRAVDNFRSALNFLKETCVQNAKGLQKMGQDTSGFLESFSRKNRQLLSFMRAENKKLVNGYAKKLEMEVFYSPQDSVKVLDKVRSVAGYLAHRNGVQEAKEVFVADDHRSSE